MRSQAKPCEAMRSRVKSGVVHTYQDEIDQLFEALFADVVQETGLANLLTVLEGEQSVFRKAIVKHVGAVTELLHLLDEVRPTDNTNRDVLAKLCEVLDGFRGCQLEKGKARRSK